MKRKVPPQQIAPPQQISPRPLILAIPEELFTGIALYMDAKSQFALAHTCRTLYKYHRNQCK
jgi:hypothetical protein